MSYETFDMGAADFSMLLGDLDCERVHHTTWKISKNHDDIALVNFYADNQAEIVVLDKDGEELYCLPGYESAKDLAKALQKEFA